MLGTHGLAAAAFDAVGGLAVLEGEALIRLIEDLLTDMMSIREE